MSSVGESSSSANSAGSAPSHESDSGSDSSSSSSESSSSSPSSSSAASESSSVSSQQAEAARAEESDESEARSSDAARDAARAGASVSAQQAAAEDAAEKKDAPTDEEAAARAGRAAVASGNVPAATEAAKAGPAARDAVEREMVARGQFQAVNDLAGELDADAPAAASEAAPAQSSVSMDQAKAAADMAATQRDARAQTRIANDYQADMAMGRPVPPKVIDPVAHDPFLGPSANRPGTPLSPAEDMVADSGRDGFDYDSASVVGTVFDAATSNPNFDNVGAFDMTVYEGPNAYVAEVVTRVEYNFVAERGRAPWTAAEKQVAAEGFEASIQASWADVPIAEVGGKGVFLDPFIDSRVADPDAQVRVDFVKEQEGVVTFEEFITGYNVMVLPSTANEGRTNRLGRTQNLVAHEYGHLIGLPDQYPKPGSKTVTDDVDNIMYAGMEVTYEQMGSLGDIARGIIENR